jgi:hypothetical protein
VLESGSGKSRGLSRMDAAGEQMSLISPALLPVLVETQSALGSVPPLADEAREQCQRPPRMSTRVLIAGGRFR